MTKKNDGQFRFIRFPELQKMLGGVSRAKIERDVANGLLPRPYKLGKRMVGFESSELEESLASFQRVPEGSYRSHVHTNKRTKR